MSGKLSKEKILALLDADGPLSASFKNFELRPEQKSMLSDVVDAYNNHQIALIEAGTGCGKSLAYLVPAILQASLYSERTVISTNTINLQEQLIHKDIPFLLKALKVDVKTALVKGMGNYLCLRKLDETWAEKYHLPVKEQEQMEQIHAESAQLKEGSRSELKHAIPHILWEKINAEHDTCTNTGCPHYSRCFFFQARKSASDALIIVANHHLLFSDLALRAESDNASLLPSYNRLILDEAHNIEDVATELFAAKVSRLGLLKNIGRLNTETGNGKTHGKLTLLKDKIQNCYSKGYPDAVQNLLTRLNLDIPNQRRDLLVHLHEAFQALHEVMQQKALSQADEKPDEVKWRLRQSLEEDAEASQQAVPKIRALISSLLKLHQTLQALEQDLKNLDNDRLNELTKGMRHEIAALSDRLQTAAKTIDTFTHSSISVQKVRWVELQPSKAFTNTHLIDADLDLSKLMQTQLFSKFATVVLASATLTTNNSFQFVRERLGLNLYENKLLEKIYASPFNYRTQALFAIPTDIPSPQHHDFISHACYHISQAAYASRGGAFALFTSYGMLKTCYSELSSALTQAGFNLFKQGDEPRQTLLHKFSTTPRAILFGTDSFWEGVDVVGDALRCVILVKLPFKVPSEPIIQARLEALQAQGKDPFMDYTIPTAIVKFKQGFGRLIRHKLDYGSIICLDSRLLHKGYGKLFISSLPLCSELFVKGNEMKKGLEDFYKKAYAQKKS